MNCRKLRIVGGWICAVFFWLGVCSNALAADPLDVWHWRNPLPQGNPLNGVAYINNLFVAVGDNGTILGSANGATWQTRNSGTTQDLYSVAYGNGAYVAVGQGGIVVTSTDGIAMQTRSSGTAHDLRGVAYGANTFVAVGGSDSAATILTSPDGATWTPRTAGANRRLWGVAYADNTFVAVGEGGVILTSADNGATWQSRTSGLDPYSGLLRAVTCGKGLFVAVGAKGYDGVILTSADNGATWQQRSTDGVFYRFYGVACSGGLFVAVGETGISAVSEDGLAWQKKDTPAISSYGPSGIAYGNQTFVAVGFAGIIYTTADGAAWQLRTTGAAKSLTNIIYANSTFVAVGEYGSILTSSDGLAWQQRTSGVSNDLHGIAYGNGRFVAVGGGGASWNAVILSSSDGVAWQTRTPGGGFNGILRAVAYGNGVFVAVGNDGANNGIIFTSTDNGENWTSRTPSGITGQFWVWGVAYGANTFVVVGGSTTADVILTSSDGSAWQARTSGGVNALHDVAYGNQRFLAVGGTDTTSTVLSSPDGITWTAHTSGTTNYLHRITYGKDAFVALGARDTLLRSIDGTVWHAMVTGPTDVPRGIAYGNNAFVLVGQYGAVLQADALMPVVPAATYTLTIGKTGAGQGTVTSAPAGINCGSSCQASFDAGTQVTLTARAAPGSIFAGWSGDCSGTQATCTVSMNGAKSATAAFSLSPFPVPGDIDGNRRIDLTDAVFALRTTAGLKVAGPIDPTVAVGGNPRVGLAEAVYALQTIAGLRSAGGVLTGGVFNSGDFRVAIAEGTMPIYINATSPQAKPETTVPVTLPIKTNETNITAGARAYTLNLAVQGFLTTTPGAVTVEIPFDPSLVPDKANIDPLHLYVKMADPSDNIVVPVHGRIVDNKIVVELRGLPQSFSVVAVYNPDMRGVYASEGSISTLAIRPEETPYLWGAKSWYVQYDKSDVYSAVQTFLNTTTDLTDAQIDSVVQAQIAGNTVTASILYKNMSFRSPALTIFSAVSDTGGKELGTTPRYSMHFTSATPAKFKWEAAKNYYGQVYIQTSDLNENRPTHGMTIFGTIAHELFHAIQGGYEILDRFTNGIVEGTATCVADTMEKRLLENALAPPSVRMYYKDISSTTFRLADSLFDYTTYIYANQDFFTYVARKYGNNHFDYLAGLFGQLHIDIGKGGINLKPPQDPSKIILDSLDLYCKGIFGASLKEIYLDFIRQRAMEHNEASRFGRPDETLSGLATGLFNVNGWGEVEIDPLNVEPDVIYCAEAFDCSQIDKLATRAIRIKPTAAIPAGGTGAAITVEVSTDGGTIGDTLVGSVYYNSTTSQPLKTEQTFTGFGLNASDEIVILLSNVYLETKSIEAIVTINGTSSTQPSSCGQTMETLRLTHDIALDIKAALRFSDGTTGEGLHIGNHYPGATETSPVSWNDTGFSMTVNFYGTIPTTIRGSLSADCKSLNLTATRVETQAIPLLYTSVTTTEVAIGGLPLISESASPSSVLYRKAGPDASSLTTLTQTTVTTNSSGGVSTTTLSSVDWTNGWVQVHFY